MRPWLSGIMSPCQGLVGVSITPGRTKTLREPPLREVLCFFVRRSHVSAISNVETGELEQQSTYERIR